jgi:hypothetical protein
MGSAREGDRTAPVPQTIIKTILSLKFSSANHGKKVFEEKPKWFSSIAV